MIVLSKIINDLFLIILLFLILYDLVLLLKLYLKQNNVLNNYFIIFIILRNIKEKI